MYILQELKNVLVSSSLTFQSAVALLDIANLLPVLAESVLSCFLAFLSSPRVSPQNIQIVVSAMFSALSDNVQLRKHLLSALLSGFPLSAASFSSAIFPPFFFYWLLSHNPRPVLPSSLPEDHFDFFVRELLECLQVLEIHFFSLEHSFSSLSSASPSSTVDTALRPCRSITMSSTVNAQIRTALHHLDILAGLAAVMDYCYNNNGCQAAKQAAVPLIETVSEAAVTRSAGLRRQAVMTTAVARPLIEGHFLTCFRYLLGWCKQFTHWKSPENDGGTLKSTRPSARSSSSFSFSFSSFSSSSSSFSVTPVSLRSPLVGSASSVIAPSFGACRSSAASSSTPSSSSSSSSSISSAAATSPIDSVFVYAFHALFFLFLRLFHNIVFRNIEVKKKQSHLTQNKSITFLDNDDGSLFAHFLLFTQLLRSPLCPFLSCASPSFFGLGAADPVRDLGHGGAFEAMLLEHLPGRGRDGFASCIRLDPQLAPSRSFLNPTVHFSLDVRKRPS